MIILLAGSNDYAIRQELARLRSGYAGESEVYDGAEITTENLLEITRGATLFSANRMVVVRGLSQQKALWAEFEDYGKNVGEDTTLVLVEPAADKRTKTYKWLQKNAEIQLFDEWTQRDRQTAIAWCLNEAKKRGIIIDRCNIEVLIDRAGIEQWRLAAALEKLELVDEITPEVITATIEPHLEENVFELLGAALSGNQKQVSVMVQALSKTDDAYRVFALLSSQIISLTTLIVSGVSPQDVARDTGTSPYVLSKLARFATGRDHAYAHQLLEHAATSDIRMKSSGMEPWVIIESMLLELSV